MEDNTVTPAPFVPTVDLKQIVIREALSALVAVAATAVAARFIARASTKATEIRAKRSAAKPE